MILFLIVFKLYKKRDLNHVIFLSSFSLKEKEGKEKCANQIRQLFDQFFTQLAFDYFYYTLLIKMIFHSVKNSQ